VPSKFTGYAALEKGVEVSKYEYEPAPLQPREIDIRVTHNGLCRESVFMIMLKVQVSCISMVCNGPPLLYRYGHPYDGESSAPRNAFKSISPYLQNLRSNLFM
jgi:hypothetical protein